MAFRYIGTSTTTITNEGTENPTINGIVVTTKTEGDIVFYQTGRYVWLDDMWNYQGDLHTHADVQSALNEIAEAYKGEEVRGSIYDAIALIDTRSAAMEDTIGANINSMVEPIVDRKISTFILDYETSVGNVAQCNLTYEQLRTKLTSNLKAIVHVNGYECDCRIDVQSTYIDVYATSDPMKNNEDTRGTIYYKFNHNNESVTVNYEQSAKKYQEELTAGPNIIIDGNEISAVGGVNTIGIEFTIDTNTKYTHDIDEITINKTWSEVELYMDAIYEDWDDYDLWHEIQKDCILKDLRDYPDYSVYPLVGVKFAYLNTGNPVLLFSSRTLSDDGTPENNVHYISFVWPSHQWSNSHLESNIDEFDISSDPKLITRNWTDTGDSDITPYPYYVRYNSDADFKSAYGISVNDLLNAVNTGKYYNLELTILTDAGGMIDLTEYSKCNVLYIDYSRYNDDELDFKVYFMADFHHTYLVDGVEHTDYYVMMPHVLNVSVSYSGSDISYIDAGVKRTHYLNKKDAGLGIRIEDGLVKVKLRSSNPGLAFDQDGGLYATGGGGSYTAGNGINISGSTISADANIYCPLYTSSNITAVNVGSSVTLTPSSNATYSAIYSRCFSENSSAKCSPIIYENRGSGQRFEYGTLLNVHFAPINNVKTMIFVVQVAADRKALYIEHNENDEITARMINYNYYKAGDGISINNRTDEISVNKNTSLEIDGNDKLGVASSILNQMASNTIIGTANGDIATFTDGGNDVPLKSCVVDIEPVQSGSGDPSPSNVRPISGWTECNVTRCGKNMFDSSLLLEASNWSVDTNGVYSGNAYNLSQLYHHNHGGFPIKFKENTQYTITFEGKCDGTSGTGLILFYLYSDGTSSQQNITVSENLQNYTFTSTAGKTVVELNCSYSSNLKTYIKNLMLTEGSTVTTYEAYKGNTYNIEFPSEAGTVYGGTLDVTNGVLTVTDGYIASYNGETLPSTWISSMDVYAEGTTPTTRAEVVYKLSTPQTYNLTPTEIKTLLGINNIFADCGDVDVEYVRDATTIINWLINNIGGDLPQAEGGGF